MERTLESVSSSRPSVYPGPAGGGGASRDEMSDGRRRERDRRNVPIRHHLEKGAAAT